MLVIIGVAVLIVACNSNTSTGNAIPVVSSTVTASYSGATATTTADATATNTPGVTPTSAAGTTPTANAGTNTNTGSAATGNTGSNTGSVPASNPGPKPTSVLAPTQSPAATPTPVPTPTPAPPSKRTITVWIQTTDSCKQALSGATFTVAGPGISTATAATGGSAPVFLSAPPGVCPIQEGNCVSISTGCTSVALNVPGSATATYTITVGSTAPGQGANLSYAICEGGSDCRHGPEVATVTVSSSGAVAATVLNPYPDGTTVTWPINKASYSGTQGDPIMFHEFGIGNGSIPCDGDHDADDYLTGAPGAHCDSDAD